MKQLEGTFALIRRYLIAGLLVWLPLWITLLTLRFVIDLLDGTFSLLPENFRPDQLLGEHIPGVGLVLSLLVLFLTGMFVANYFGNRLVLIWESFLARIPLVRTIYAGVKKILETIVSPTGQAFRKVVFVQFPREGIWTVAFQTGNGTHEVANHLNGEAMITVYVPTTPNPTGGYLVLVPKKDVIESSMTVDEALRFIISLGVLEPRQKDITRILDKK